MLQIGELRSPICNKYAPQHPVGLSQPPFCCRRAVFGAICSKHTPICFANRVCLLQIDPKGPFCGRLSVSCGQTARICGPFFNFSVPFALSTPQFVTRSSLRELFDTNCGVLSTNRGTRCFASWGCTVLRTVRVTPPIVAHIVVLSIVRLMHVPREARHKLQPDDCQHNNVGHKSGGGLFSHVFLPSTEIIWGNHKMKGPKNGKCARFSALK